MTISTNKQTRVVTAHIPIALAEKLEQLVERHDRSRGWVMTQALSAWIAQEEERYQLTLEALHDVDFGHVIDHQSVIAWASSLNDESPLPIPVR